MSEGQLRVKDCLETMGTEYFSPAGQYQDVLGPSGNMIMVTYTKLFCVRQLTCAMHFGLKYAQKYLAPPPKFPPVHGCSCAPSPPPAPLPAPDPSSETPPPLGCSILSHKNLTPPPSLPVALLASSRNSSNKFPKLRACNTIAGTPLINERFDTTLIAAVFPGF